MVAARHFGWAGPGVPDSADHWYAARPQVVAALPPKVQLFLPPLGPPLDPNINQLNLGSCGPNSAAIMLISLMLRALGKAVIPSRLFIYYCTRMLMGTINSDSGVYNRDLLKALHQYGWCDEKLWPYDVPKFKTKPSAAAFAAAENQKIDEYMAVPQYLADMKASIAEGYPILFGFTVFTSMLSAAVDQSGDIPMRQQGDKVEGGHDCVIFGYDDETQLFDLRNPWGIWGGKGSGSGNGTIPYAYATASDMAGDFWSIRKSAWEPGPSPELQMSITKGVPKGKWFLAKTGTASAPTLTAPQPIPAGKYTVTPS